MLSGTNGCGTDTKSMQVTYVPCTAPTLTLQGTNATVTSPAYVFNATVNGVSAQELTLTLNGNPVQNVSLNGNSRAAKNRQGNLSGCQLTPTFRTDTTPVP